MLVRKSRMNTDVVDKSVQEEKFTYTNIAGAMLPRSNNEHVVEKLVLEGGKLLFFPPFFSELGAEMTAPRRYIKAQRKRYDLFTMLVQKLKCLQ